MKKYYHKLIKLLIVGFLFPACREQETAIEQLSRVKVDEHSLVISARPSRICILSDSILATVINEETVCIYNYLNGKLLETWQPDSLPADSLIRNYYQRLYPERNYIVPVMPFNKINQMPGFKLYDLQPLPDDRFCIAAGISTPFEETIDGRREGSFNYSYCLFIFNRSTRHIEQLIPFRTETGPHSFAFFPGGFYFRNERVFVNHLSLDSLTEHTSAVVSYHLKEKDPVPALLPVHYPAFFPQDWLYYNFFREEKNTLLVSNQEAIYDVLTGKTVYSGLADNRKHEFLMNFSLMEGHPHVLFYHLFLNDPAHKKHGNRLCVYDVKESKLIEKAPLLPLSSFFVVDFYKEYAVTMHKEGEHYYFSRYVCRP